MLNYRGLTCAFDWQPGCTDSGGHPADLAVSAARTAALTLPRQPKQGPRSAGVHALALPLATIPAIFPGSGHDDYSLFLTFLPK